MLAVAVLISGPNIQENGACIGASVSGYPIFHNCVINNFWNCHCGFLSNLYSGICNLFLVELLLTVAYAEKYEVHGGKSRLS